jgi:hypothetical protein
VEWARIDGERKRAQVVLRGCESLPSRYLRPKIGGGGCDFCLNKCLLLLPQRFVQMLGWAQGYARLRQATVNESGLVKRRMEGEVQEHARTNKSTQPPAIGRLWRTVGKKQGSSWKSCLRVALPAGRLSGGFGCRRRRRRRWPVDQP